MLCDQFFFFKISFRNFSMFEGCYCLHRRTVSSFLEGGFREKIDKIMISCMQKRLEVESNLVEEEEEEDNEESLVECSARCQENLEENETEKENLEPVTVSDGFSHYLLIAATISLNTKDHAS